MTTIFNDKQRIKAERTFCSVLPRVMPLEEASSFQKQKEQRASHKNGSRHKPETTHKKRQPKNGSFVDDQVLNIQIIIINS